MSHVPRNLHSRLVKRHHDYEQLPVREDLDAVYVVTLVQWGDMSHENRRIEREVEDKAAF